MIQGELFDRLRVKMAVSYAPDVDAVALRGGTAWLEGTLDVDGKAAPQALAIVRALVRPRAAVRPSTAKGFERLRWQKARRSALMNDTNDELARAIFDAWNMGWEPAVLDDYPRDLAAITAGRSDRCVRRLPRAQRDHRARRGAHRLQLTA